MPCAYSTGDITNITLFLQNTIHELFEVDDKESDATKRMAELLQTPVDSPTPLNPIEEVPAIKTEDVSKRNAA